MRSMTGFGRGSAPASTGGEWIVECASVNRKQLEIQLNASKTWSVLEAEIRREITTRFHRGRIVFTLLPPVSAATNRLTIDPALAAAAAADLRHLQETLDISGPLTLDQLLSHPLLRSVTEGDSLVDPLAAWEEILPALRSALEALESMRRREGHALQQEILRLLQELNGAVKHISEKAPEVPRRHREVLLERLRQIDLPQWPDEGRLAAELALFAERCDITEELARLQAHLEHFSEILHQDGPCGRPLEFVVQEIHRELNTTGAKSAHSAISRAVVECKTTLEKIREQLANVE